MNCKITSIIIFLLLSFSVSKSQQIVWETKTNFPYKVRNGKAVALNSQIYFMGGYCNETKERFEKFVYKYDKANDKWIECKELLTGRSNFTVQGYNGKFYVIGGDPFSPKTEVYNPEIDSWETLAPMLTPRQHLEGVVLDGKIYMIGGLRDKLNSSAPSEWDYENVTNINEVYDIATNSWSTKAPMPTPRHDSHLAAVNGKIYSIGGMGTEENIWEPLSTVEMYDPKTDSWKAKKSLPSALDGFGTAVIDNEIYVIGGFSSSGVENTVYIYNPDKDNWRLGTNFPNRENGSPGCAVIDNKIYIIGGSDKNYNATSNFIVGTVK